jgi:hypothetical protein
MKTKFISGIITFPQRDHYEIMITRYIKSNELIFLPCVETKTYSYPYDNRVFIAIDRATRIFNLHNKNVANCYKKYLEEPTDVDV